AALKMDEVFGLQLAQIVPQVKEIEVPADVKELAERRYAAKKNKDWAAADALRAEITAKGYAVKDTKDGYTVEKL
ncbi:MAG: cysteine--tRNA ligase, partial [Clostridia bacterium]|nr:cysteine--tRNA ligase [Clostridia bacterium]